MKPFFAALVLAVLAVQSVQADWVIVQKTNSDGKEQDVTLKVKGDKARSDMGEKMSMILDGAEGKVVLLMHDRKAMMKMDGDSMKGMMALAGNLLGGKDKKPVKPEATGQMEKIGEYDTEIYTWTGPLGSGKFWVAKNFPNAEELNRVQDKLTKAMGNPVAAFAPSSTDFPGMVVKTEMQMMGKKIVSETVSATQRPVDDAIFVLPTDYEEMKMPKLPSGGK